MNLVERLCSELRRRGQMVSGEILTETLRSLDVTLVEGQRAAVNSHLSRHEDLARKVMSE